MTEIRKILYALVNDTLYLTDSSTKKDVNKAEAAIIEAVGMCFYRSSLVKNFNADGFTIAWVKKNTPSKP